MSDASRVRREPPRFRRVEVRRLEARTPRLTRVTLAGPDLEGRRERWGTSYITVQSDGMEAAAPIVAKLAGT